MAYCTQDDILKLISEEILIQLSDDNGAGIVDETKVSGAISDADAVIDGYCGKRYSVPLSPVPVLARKLSVDISIYNLYANRQGAPDDRKMRYDGAINLLKDIAKGVVTLGADAPAEISGDTSDNTVEISSATPIFSRNKLKGF